MRFYFEIQPFSNFYQFNFLKIDLDKFLLKIHWDKKNMMLYQWKSLVRTQWGNDSSCVCDEKIFWTESSTSFSRAIDRLIGKRERERKKRACVCRLRKPYSSPKRLLIRFFGDLYLQNEAEYRENLPTFVPPLQTPPILSTCYTQFGKYVRKYLRIRNYFLFQLRMPNKNG